MIKSWSYSRLVTFESCPFRAKLQYVDRIPEPERHLPPGKTEHANDRGTRVHEAAELYVKGGVELLPELQCFTEEFAQLREMYKEGRVSLEGEWGHARDWSAVAWMSDNVWLRLKLDAMVHVGNDHAVVIDYKTGKRNGNEIKHTEQGQLYAAATQARYPELQNITVEFWYTDLNNIVSAEYTYEDLLGIRSRFEARGARITDETAFSAKPSIFNCKYCPYGTWGTGHCTKGVGGRADLWKPVAFPARLGGDSSIRHLNPSG
jgi:CRISPR/Cas system-associated exonuclease Cas4 (RecB family)